MSACLCIVAFLVGVCKYNTIQKKLSFEGVLRVEHIDTKENSSDILTKAIPIDTFVKHGTRLLNVKTAKFRPVMQVIMED